MYVALDCTQGPSARENKQQSVLYPNIQKEVSMFLISRIPANECKDQGIVEKTHFELIFDYI